MDTAHITMPSNSKKYTVVAIDHLTQWIEVAIFTHETSQSIMNFIEGKNIDEAWVSQKDTN